MQERDVLAFGADTWPIVDETNACRTAALECAFEVVDDKTDVMNSRPAFRDEFADG